MDAVSRKGLHVMDEYYMNEIAEICKEYEEAIESGEIRSDFDDEVEKMVRFERICDLVREWMNG